jgi:hypothetical protein
LLLPLKLYASVSHPDYGDAWTRIWEGPTSATPDEARPSFEKVSVQLRPLTTITGQIVEGDTGEGIKLFNTLLTLVPQVIRAYYDEGFFDGPADHYHDSIKIEPGLAVATIQPGGTFMLKVPVGTNRFFLSGLPYRAGQGQRANGGDPIMQFDVPSEGKKDWTIRVEKWPAFCFGFQSDDPAKIKWASVYIRKSPDDKPESLGRFENDANRIWMKRANWGDKIEVKLGDPAKDPGLIPWTEVTAAPKNWPIMIKVP